MSNLDLTEHTGFIYKLMQKRRIEEQDKEDTYQDFLVYCLSYPYYDETKGSPTTYLGLAFSNYMSVVKLKQTKQQALLEATHIEERDKDYLDRELGGYESEIEDAICLNQILDKTDEITASIVRGEITCASQAKKEGITRQSMQEKHQRRLKKLIEGK